MSEHRSIAARFGAAAPTYERHAAVQEAVAARVLDMLEGTPAPAAILEIGCGTGQLTARLAERFPSAAILACDLAEPMIRQARNRLSPHPRVRFTVGDARTIRPRDPVDLVVSSSAMHWVTPLRAAFGGCRRALAPGGRLACALMVRGTLAELHAARRAVAPGKPVRARLPGEQDVLRAARAEGFTVERRHHQQLRAAFPSARAFLRALHEQGLTGGPLSSARTPLNRTELDRLADHYDRHYADPAGRVAATHEVLFLDCRRVEGDSNAPRRS